HMPGCAAGTACACYAATGSLPYYQSVFPAWEAGKSSAARQDVPAATGPCPAHCNKYKGRYWHASFFRTLSIVASSTFPLYGTEHKYLLCPFTGKQHIAPVFKFVVFPGKAHRCKVCTQAGHVALFPVQVMHFNGHVVYLFP